MEKETAYPVLFLDPDHGFLVGPEVPENRQPLPNPVRIVPTIWTPPGGIEENQNFLKKFVGEVDKSRP